MCPVLEAKLERLFYDLVRSERRGIVVKLAPTVRGLPDRLVLLPGGFIHLVELKTETGALSPVQQVWHDRAAQLGVHVHVLYGEAEIRRWVRSV